MMKSPFDELEIDKDLVCEFFATFMRFEYAMKATSYCGCDRYDNAVPNWKKLKSELGDQICPAQDDPRIVYLVNKPPEVQKCVDERPKFEADPLTDEGFGQKALESAKRVRNNLFHGGKSTRYSPPERDTRLIRGALAVLEACLDLDPALRTEFEHQLA